jgi:hypothetical protein
VPTPDAQPSATPTAGEIERTVVDDLSSLYGMHLGHLSRAHQYHYMLGQFETWQLDLVRQAAADFAWRIEGGAPRLKGRIAPVFLYKSEGALPLGGQPQRAYAWVGNIVAFAGDQGSWEDMLGQKWTVVHELAHVWDIKSGFRFSRGMIARRMWTFTEGGECQVPRRPVKPPDVRVQEWRAGRSTVGLNPREDWADAVAAYVYKGYADTKDWEISETRWYFVAREMNPGNTERHSYPDEWRGLRFDEAEVASGQ